MPRQASTAQPPSSQIRMPRAAIKSMKSRTAAAVISVIDTLHEPLIVGDVVVELTQQGVVEHSLPVLANDGLVPPRRLDLPAGDRVDRAGERSRDGLGRTAGAEDDIDRGR